MSPSPLPGIRLERSLFAQGHDVVAGLDEVGRGAWAGPVSVGAAVVTAPALRRLPKGVRDSKQLTPRARERLVPAIEAVVTAYAIGHASPLECDMLGMTRALRLAADRALAQLPRRPDVIILDGTHNYTGRRETTTLARADARCRLVAAASVLAKVTRDRLMVELAGEFPDYGFDRHKGYICDAHRAAVARHGLSAAHRASWGVRPYSGVGELPAFGSDTGDTETIPASRV